MQIEGIDPGKLGEHLLDEAPDRHRRRSTHAQFEGIRVTPNVYTTPDEIDIFVDAMKQVLAKGV